MYGKRCIHRAISDAIKAFGGWDSILHNISGDGRFFRCTYFRAGIIEVATPGGLSENSPVIIIIGLCAILGLIACLIGIGLGIAGVLQKNRKIIFSILGLIFNATILLGVVVLIIVGNLM